MAFHEIRLPEKFSRPAVGGQGFSTEVVDTLGGLETRNINFDQDRGQWDISQTVKTPEQFAELKAFHANRRGRGHSFRFKWWPDYQARKTFQAIGDGATNSFQLVKTYADLLTGQAQAGGAATITLAASAGVWPFHAVDDTYNEKIIRLTGGTGAGQVRRITDYTGASKLATVAPAWSTPPDATSLYEIELFQYPKDILKPAPDGIAPVFYINDSTAPATLDFTDGTYSIDAGAPASGAILLADFDFDFPVRFDVDFQREEFATIRSRNWRGIGLKEVYETV